MPSFCMQGNAWTWVCVDPYEIGVAADVLSAELTMSVTVLIWVGAKPIRDLFLGSRLQQSAQCVQAEQIAVTCNSASSAVSLLLLLYYFFMRIGGRRTSFKIHSHIESYDICMEH